VSDALSPESAAAADIVLKRLLWLRMSAERKQRVSDRPWSRLEQALKATDLLLQAGGFAAIVLDMGDVLSQHTMRIPLGTWYRLRLAAEQARTALIFLTQPPCASSCAALALRCEPSSVTPFSKNGETALFERQQYALVRERIRILAPIIGIRRKTDKEAEKDPYQNKPVLVGFRNAYVFDVSQTEGAELPAMHEVHGDVGENRDRLVSYIERQSIELVFTENIAPALGVSHGGRIAILPGQSEAEEFSTLVHELAHEMLHKAERRTTTTKVVKETEAEAVAFVIGNAMHQWLDRWQRASCGRGN
jgi:hypothetical protein